MLSRPFLSIVSQCCQFAVIIILDKSFDVGDYGVTQFTVCNVVCCNSFTSNAASLFDFAETTCISKERFPFLIKRIAIKIILAIFTFRDTGSEHTDCRHFFANSCIRTFTGNPQSGTSYGKRTSFLNLASGSKCRQRQAQRQHNSQHQCGCAFNVFHTKLPFSLYMVCSVRPYLFTQCASLLPLRLRGTESASSRIPTPTTTYSQSPVLPVSGSMG